MNPENFFSELKRRNVLRMAGLYLVGAWLVVQVAGTVLPMFGAPEWLPRTIVVLLTIGFVPAVIFSWVFELTPEGLKRDVLQYFAITAAWAGDKELALQQLEAGLRAPDASQMLSYGALKLFPVWDPLRGDPRFEQIVESLAPKDH
jgi:hypothetical protein